MSDEGLYSLYKLHLIDSKLHEIRSKAASLDVGKADAEAYRAIEKETQPIRERAKSMATELKQKEDEQATIMAKLKKFNGQLYDGSIHNAKEIESIQKEIEMLNRLAASLDDQILALMEQLPRVQEEALAAERQLKQKREIVAQKQAKAKTDHATLTQEYQNVGNQRNGAKAKVPPEILRPYEAQIEKLKVAMATITEAERCSYCGAHVPERTVQMVRAGKVCHCENCRRILFILMPGVE
ncbi:MAG: hypothetical protein MUC92_05730 [Fimbriimonadaceae bacterium]|jgi:predicted  nucleic acid-binding Zn-ribbon protein|nr:hypothetical protein [Fimbriimonadaceae bacterium]